jgi:hypothetical protein
VRPVADWGDGPNEEESKGTVVAEGRALFIMSREMLLSCLWE